jgi:hypothetical protein
MVAAIDMTYWVADEPVVEGTKEPETIALCFGLEGKDLSDYGPMLVWSYYSRNEYAGRHKGVMWNAVG